VNVSDLREILQYVPRFRGRTFVIAVDGKVAASTNFANILLDLAVLRSLSIRTVVVHGASWQIEELARRLFKTSSNIRNVRTFFSTHRGKFEANAPVRVVADRAGHHLAGEIGVGQSPSGQLLHDLAIIGSSLLKRLVK